MTTMFFLEWSPYLNLVQFIQTGKASLFFLKSIKGSGVSDSEESACNAGDLDSIPGLGRSSGGGHGNPLQYSCLENSHGQRSLVGYSPWGRKESDTTECLSTAQHKVDSYESK